MKNLFATFILILSVLLINPGFVLSAPSKMIIAKVGGIPVTIFELERAAQKLVPLRSSFHSGISDEKVKEARRDALAELIEQAYKVRGALEHEISVDNSLVNKEIAEIRAKYTSDREFEAIFGDEGLSGYKAARYRALLAKKAEDQLVTKKAQVDEAKVRAYYEEHKTTYIRPDQFRASHILIKVDPSSNSDEIDEIKDRATKLLERAKAGEDFYDLAYHNSKDRSAMIGGDLGYFHEGQTVPEFENALKALKPGGISGLVRTRWGFHIIKMTEFNPSRQLEFEDMAEKLRTKFREESRAELYQQWMEGLKSRYSVEKF